MRVSTELGLQAELDVAGKRYSSRVREALEAGLPEERVQYEVVTVGAGGTSISTPLSVPRGVALTGPAPLIGGRGFIGCTDSKDD